MSITYMRNRVKSGDADKARRTFAAYHHCTDCYCKRHAMGATMEQLAVKGA